MKTRFIYELAIGIIGIGAVLFWGEIGMATFSLLAFNPFIGKGKSSLVKWNRQKWDEREYYLFYKTGNWTMLITLVAMIIIYFCRNLSLNEHLVNDSWLLLSVNAFLFAHGLSGLIIFDKN
jgi:hypothetical protein